MANYPFLLYIPNNFQKQFYQFRKQTKELSTSKVICRIIKEYMEDKSTLNIPYLRELLKENPEQVSQIRKLLNEFKDDGDIIDTGGHFA